MSILKKLPHLESFYLDHISVKYSGVVLDKLESFKRCDTKLKVLDISSTNVLNEKAVEASMMPKARDDNGM